MARYHSNDYDQLTALAAALAVVDGYTQKIDNLATDGLVGVNNSLAYRVHEIEKHFHGDERWFGKLGVQTATDWGEQASLTPYRAISGNGDFGGDPNDEALVLGVDDTPAIALMQRHDTHRMLITAASNATDWVLRFVCGTGTMADAEAAGMYSDVMVQEARKGAPIELMMPRGYDSATKCWMRAKNATNNATIDFFIGLHEYEG